MQAQELGLRNLPVLYFLILYGLNSSYSTILYQN